MDSLDTQVVIIGGGFAGVSTAYQLALSGIESVLLEAGTVGLGSDEEGMLSGTAVPELPKYSKMVVSTINPSIGEHIKRFGVDDTRLRHWLHKEGIELVRAQAEPILAVRNMGSIIVEGQEPGWDIQKELEAYRQLDTEFAEHYHPATPEEVSAIFGTDKLGTGFHMYDDIIVDQRKLTEGLLKLAGGKTEVLERCLVTSVEDKGDHVTITSNRGVINAAYAVIATNAFSDGFCANPRLDNLLTPYWSFIQCYEDNGPDAPCSKNFVSGDYFYFTRQDGMLLIGGADIPAEKINGRFAVDETAPMEVLRQYANDNFPQTVGEQPVATHFGMWADTKDSMPIVGKFDDGRIAYITGCSGSGMQVLAVGAKLMPRILGYTAATGKDRMFLELLSPHRPTLK